MGEEDRVQGSDVGDRMDQPTVLALCERLCPSMNGSVSTRLAQALLGGDREEVAWLERECDALPPDGIRYWRDEICRLSESGVMVLTAASQHYPTNLAMVHDGPPALFVRGGLSPEDRRSVALVGSRGAGKVGTGLAHRIAGSLAQRNVTVVSGLARGIDTAAHSGAVSAGGRTIAVFGTTIDQIYPASNRGLARSVSEHGACVSQFLPGRSTGPWAFPVRNVTMSGLSLGTIVVEAGDTSGARLQAQAALAHGKRVFLVEDLVTHQPWARAMADAPNVIVSSDPDEIVESVDELLAPVDGLLL